MAFFGGARDCARQRFARICEDKRIVAGAADRDVKLLTFATLLLSKGAPITYVASQLGHASPNTTLRW